MTYPDAIRYLYDLRWFGAKLGLENTLKLAELAGNPQNRLRFIHVAGTNGKGSTCAMLESIYRAAGLRVGLYTSPHLVSFRERIQVNRRLIGESDVVRLVCELQPHLKQFPEEHHPTFFEVVTVMALRYFAEQKCDLVVWETGLGGRLDATNIVTPLASVITNVQFDHQQWLGDTLGKIASEKAGIIKPGVPVLTAAQEPEALAVIEAIATANDSPLHKVRCDSADEGAKTAVLPLAGEHQKRNAALALATVAVLQHQIPVGEAAIQTGLRTLTWPGRLQLIELGDGRRFLLDGAHNVAGIQALRAALQKDFSANKRTLILGVLADKDWRKICEILAPLFSKVLTVPVSSERTAAANELAAAFRAANPTASVEPCDSLSAALARTAPGDFVVVAGSLYLVGEALEVLNLTGQVCANERALNEWGGRPQGQAQTASKPSANSVVKSD